MPHKMEFTVDCRGNPRQVELDIERGYNLGFTIRDAAKMQAHLDEVAKEGVPPPATDNPPIIFPISPWAWLTSPECTVQTSHTSGEVEIFLADTEEGLLIGVASDQTDRKLEAIDIPCSKQVAPNIVAPNLWRWEDLADHWDECTLDSWVTKNGTRSHYQHASTSEFWTPPEMVASLQGRIPAGRPRLFVSGTVVSLGAELIYGDQWEISLTDPVMKREIRHSYQVIVLADEVVG